MPGLTVITKFLYKYGLAVLMRIFYKFSHSLGNDYPPKAIMGQGIYTTGFG